MQTGGQGAGTSAHKPSDAEGKLRGHRKPAKGSLAHTSLCDAEGTVRELRKDPHNLLPSMLPAAVQGGNGKQKHW